MRVSLQPTRSIQRLHRASSSLHGRYPNMSQDYTHWTHPDLITRITTLETQLRTRNLQHTSSAPSPAFRKPKKAPKPFDASKYHTRLIALKFAYLGKRYNGFEHHAKNVTPLPTVEEALWRALRKTRLIAPDFGERREEEVCWEGCEYSKCGRTDRGVSAFGQVIAVRVRSSRPKEKEQVEVEEGEAEEGKEVKQSLENGLQEWDSVKDELPYVQLLNRVLPPDIRMLAWCPEPPPNFSARFNCKERRYRYFFTNPAYAPIPGEQRKGGDHGPWLDIEAMRSAAKKLEGLHDFRNMCKVDPSKQISDFRRRVFFADIHKLQSDQGAGAVLQRTPFCNEGSSEAVQPSTPEVYYFEVRGSAFLWHQVRHMMAVLFLVGQGYEPPSIVDQLLDIDKTPAKPVYDMAHDTPLVLWDCIFPAADDLVYDSHDARSGMGYEDKLDWHYVGDGADSSRSSTGTEDRKYGRMGLMEDVWSLWQSRRMDELLAGSLTDVVARQGKKQYVDVKDGPHYADKSDRVHDGSDGPRMVGRYIPLMQRDRLDAPDVVNARYAVRKGLATVEVVNDE